MDFNPSDRMPFSRLMGVEIVEASKDKILGRLTVTETLCTSGHILHGGAVMAFADALGAIGAVMNLPEGANGTTTIESKTNFIGGAKEGVVITGESIPVHVGRRTSVWQTDIRTEEGKRVALVTQSQMVL